MDKPVEVVHFM